MPEKDEKPEKTQGDEPKATKESGEEKTNEANNGSTDVGGLPPEAKPGDDDDEEMLARATKEVSVEEFYDHAKRKRCVPKRGETSDQQEHWVRPRRWDVRLWDVKFRNMEESTGMVFISFNFGGNLEEFNVKSGNKHAIRLAGIPGMMFQTPLVEDAANDNEAEEVTFDESFEWYASYMDIEMQSLVIELWHFSNLSINKFDSYHDEPLVTFAKGGLTNEVGLKKVGRGKRPDRARISFRLLLQEIYDFELDFIAWRASDLKQATELLEHVEAGGGNEVGHHRSSLHRTSTVAKQQENQNMRFKIRIHTPGNAKHFCSGKMLTSTYVGGRSPDWDGLGCVQFRGTASDLNNAYINVEVISDERGVFGKTCCACSGTSVGFAKIPLKGAIDHGDVKINLLPAPWLRRYNDVETMQLMDCGYLEGHISIQHRPRHYQGEEGAYELDFNKPYLFVKVVKIDRIVTPDMRPTDEIDTFVEVTFDGMSRKTRLMEDDIAPFGDKLVFDLLLPLLHGENGETLKFDASMQNSEHIWHEIEGKGPIHVDVWAKGPLCNEHLGWCEVFLSEILTNESGEARDHVDKTEYSSVQKMEKNLQSPNIP